ncbi:T9SS type A sorting domain-containing protein [Epilithonimonas sp. UC225_85]|uniref:T9SS type A sorting domain-containing protein n=1 Tax=Epilithonimonas sp. UC225_85 TaxID=3350167 RepID=UPI0036D2B9F4
MKKTFVLTLILGIASLINAQIVNIPDANFKAYLVANPEINTNGDSQIQVSEANAFAGTINIYNKGIINLTGIEVFVNMTVLQCPVNNLTSLDISKNTKLTGLYCGNNQLTTLDVSRNTALTNIYCENNKIISLDVTKNTVLAAISCGGNLLTNLDISKNTKFTWLYCPRNPLLNNINLSNGNNTKLSSIYIVDNPNLTCVQVDDVNYANAQPTYLWQKDATTSYSTSCLLSTNESGKPQIKIYPNPAKDNINFSEEIRNIKITDLSGKIVKQISNSDKSINVSKLVKGTYIITAVSKSGETINKKFIKE